MKAFWNETIIAESNETIVIENNHYFPVSAINQACLLPSETRTYCPWKGEASYYTLTINGHENKDAARQINGYVAFWKGVKVES